MSPLEIALIIVGIIVIIVSCRLIDSTKNEQKQLIGKSIASLDLSLSDTDKKQLMEKLNQMVSEVTEEAIVHTDDALSKISNEKIMSINEFTDQLMEKIKRNHEEVVFLYNMLNDKEKELKATVREIDTAKKKVQEIMDSKAEHDNSHITLKQHSLPVGKSNSPISSVRQDQENIAQPPLAESFQEHLTENNKSINNNSQILELYSQGKSIVEISKLLSLGQGEVKLVIELYKGKK